MKKTSFFNDFPDGGSEIVSIIPMNEEESAKIEIPDTLPLVALKNIVLFPTAVAPISVGRDKSLSAIKIANKTDKLIAVITQTNGDVENPTEEDLYSIGTVARILKEIKLPDNTSTVLVQGLKRIKLRGIIQESPFLLASIETLKEEKPENKAEYEIAITAIRQLANDIITMNPQIPNDASAMLKNINSSDFLLNFIVTNLSADIKLKQDVLSENEPTKKANKILEIMYKEIKVLEIKENLENKVRSDINKQQRDYYLNQQLKTIQEELGNNPQTEEINNYENKAAEKKWPKKAKERFDKELMKLKRMNPQAAEYNVQMNFIELFLDLPWEKYTKDNYNLSKVIEQLDKDHFGLEKVKNRIVEHMAILKLKNNMKAPIICLVGPPGVGKTSLGKSIATAMNRNFVRMSLGGLHDESEIRGHRKTYIGAMPGRILQSLKKTASGNPVFMLDEIDKMGKDFRGDPSSALLEVLDPEQNHSFYDNYLEQEYDLSKVLFIATANSLSTIQPALLDRMEIIHISGYSVEEKIQIAQKHLIPEQLENHGLKAKDIDLSDDVLLDIIQKYTKESGVRGLNRQVANVMRFVAKNVAMKKDYNKTIAQSDLEEILGVEIYNIDTETFIDTPGMAIGLAWTSVGGDVLFIETSLSKGKGKLTLTGNLGNVMKESATTALSFIRANAEKLGIEDLDFDATDIHIHVPEGAIPKDGPSAGITMLSALTSAFTGKNVKPKLAMTGEITLRGKVLPVGGIKEKVLAAKRAYMDTIILSKENERHVKEIEQEYLEGLNFIFVKNMWEVLDNALVK